jgi:hypothetical protein
VVLCILPLFLRLWPIGHGLPANYVPDTHVVKNALGMAQARNPVPQAGEYSTYPNLIPYMLLPVYAAEYALGRAQGAWGGTEEFGERLLEEPWRAHLPARVLVALLSALAPLFVFRGLRAAGLAGGAWVGAYLAATCLLHVHLSLHERPWAPLATFMALAAWPAASYVRSGARRSLVLSGLAGALSFACHQGGLPAIGIPALAWLFGPLGWRAAALRERLVSGALCVAGFVVLALVVGHPYFLVHGLDAQRVAAGDLAGGQGITVGGQPFLFVLRGATFVKLSRALVGYDPLLVALGLLGVVPALARRATRPMTAFALAWGAVFMTNQSDHVRYLLPLAIGLTWPAGVAAERLLENPWGRGLVPLLCALPLVQALRLGVVLRHDDTRAQMTEVLARYRGDARIAVDVGGPELPLDAQSLLRLSDWRALSRREAHRLGAYEAGREPPTPGFDAVPLQELYDFEYRYGASWPNDAARAAFGADATDPTLVLERLGVTHVLLVDKTPDDARPPLLIDDAPPSQVPDVDLVQHASGVRPKLAPLRLVPIPLEELRPTAPGQRAQSARLPTELDFPLTELWRVERPGPALALYRFRH